MSIKASMRNGKGMLMIISVKSNMAKNLSIKFRSSIPTTNLKLLMVITVFRILRIKMQG